MGETRPARFAIISNNAFSLVNFRAPLIDEIVQRGHKVYALAPDFDQPSRAAITDIGAEPISISMSRTGVNPARDAWDILRLRQELARLRLDVVLGFAIKPVIYGMLAAKSAGVPRRFALIAGLGYAFGDAANGAARGRVLHHLARTFYTAALARTDRVFMQNPDDLRDFERMNIVARDKMVLVNGTGVDLEHWPLLEPITQPVTFLLAARLLFAKGVREFVSAARMLKPDYPAARFILLGGTDTNPDAIATGQVEEWVKEGLIEWPGHVDVHPWLARSSVYVLPSYYREGVPRSIQEALASGRPVITADTPGCRETVVEGVNGFLVPPRDPEALAAAMRRFLKQPQLIIDMGQQSRLVAQERFDVHAINALMINGMGL